MTGENTENSELPGSRLRRQRERQGLTLAQAGHELHVDQRLLAALEADDYTALGAPIFVKGHLRNYARLLGLDPAELIAEYEAAQQPADPTLVAHRPDGPVMDAHRERAWVSWIGWIFLLLLGVLLAAWWYYQQEGGADFTLSNTPDPVLLPQAPPPDTTRTETARDTNAVPERDLSSTSTSEQDEIFTGEDSVQPAVDVPQESAASMDDNSDASNDSAATASPETVAPPAVRPRPATPAASGLVLEIAEESWVEIYDAEGRPILYDLLAPGVRREINASGELRLFLGNADGVKVYVNGRAFNVAPFVRSDSTARFTVDVPAN